MSVIELKMLGLSQTSFRRRLRTLGLSSNLLHAHSSNPGHKPRCTLRPAFRPPNSNELLIEAGEEVEADIT